MASHSLTWVAGGSGLIGRALLTELKERPVLALVRRPLTGMPIEPLRQEAVVSLLALPANLPTPAQVFIALGTTLAQAGSQQAFRAVDFDAVLSVARAAKAAGARHCAVVSALGADARSGVFYNRVKGEAEDALTAIGFDRLVIAQPSLLDGEREALGQPRRAGEAWALRLTRPLAGLIPAAWRPIAAQRVARAMCRALEQPGEAVRRLPSAEMQRLGA